MGLGHPNWLVSPKRDVIGGPTQQEQADPRLFGTCREIAVPSVFFVKVLRSLVSSFLTMNVFLHLELELLHTCSRLVADCTTWIGGRLYNLDQCLSQFYRRSSSQTRIKAIHLSPFSFCKGVLKENEIGPSGDPQ